MYKQVWDLRTGACLDGAGSDPVDLRTWPVAVVDGEVWIEPRGDEVTGSPFASSVGPWHPRPASSPTR